MYDNVRKCPNCGSDAPCMGSLMKCKDCGGVYCNNCSGNRYGGIRPFYGSNKSNSI